MRHMLRLWVTYSDRSETSPDTSSRPGRSSPKPHPMKSRRKNRMRHLMLYLLEKLSYQVLLMTRFKNCSSSIPGTMTIGRKLLQSTSTASFASQESKLQNPTSEWIQETIQSRNTSLTNWKSHTTSSRSHMRVSRMLHTFSKLSRLRFPS